MSTHVPTLEPTELSRRLASEAPPVVLDVREPAELDLARFPGAIHIPMDEVPDRLEELDRRRPLVVLCHLGLRSQMVADFLSRSGFDRVSNLSGGIDAWAVEVDPRVPRY